MDAAEISSRWEIQPSLVMIDGDIFKLLKSKFSTTGVALKAVYAVQLSQTTAQTRPTPLQNHFPVVACPLRMVEIGSLISSLPDRPLPVTTVEGLEEHDAIVVSDALLTEETSTGPVTIQFALVTSTIGVILEYVPEDGWTVIERASSDEHSPKELLLALSVESIKDGIEHNDTAATASNRQKRDEPLSGNNSHR